jgi:hypothetical protein
MRTNYRFYLLDPDRHIVDVEVVPDCCSDAEARRMAVLVLEQHPRCGGVTVWERERKVCELSAPARANARMKDHERRA